MVLRRFLNTRGNVKQLRSDNGSNFIGAERERRQAVKQWNHGQIEEELQVRATVNGDIPSTRCVTHVWCVGETDPRR